MSAALQKVGERQEKRFRLLKTIYDHSGDSTTEGIHYAEAFEKAGLEEDEGHNILNYLYEQGLLSKRTGIGWLALSHEGIIEVEQSLLHPEADTEHFKSGIIQHFYGEVGVVQNAGDSTANVTHHNDGGGHPLSADRQVVIQRQERRRRMMLRIYEKAEGNINNHVFYDEVQEEEGLTDMEFNAVFDYLKAEGLVSDRYVGGGTFEITQKGVEYAERQLKHPHAGDALTASGRLEQHFYRPVGAVQNGPGNTAHITQYNAGDSAELLRLIQELRVKVEAAQGETEVLDKISELEKEAKSDSPKKSTIIETAKYIGNMVRDMGVGVAAEAIVKATSG
jgi:hypothetical protein